MKKRLSLGRCAAFLLAAVLTLCAIFVSGKAVMRRLYPLGCRELVEKYAEEFGVDKYLLFAVIKTESSFDPNAVSDADAHGLTQITPETCEWIAMKLGEDADVSGLHNPETSIKYGAFLLGYLLEKFGDRDAAIAAYHAGMGAVSGWLNNGNYSSDGKTLNNIPIKATEHYVHKVNSAYNIYTDLYSSDIVDKTFPFSR